MKWKLIVLPAALFCCKSATAYEVGTHAKITDEAYKRSIISTGSKLAQYGLYDMSHIVGTQFKEVAGAQTVDRTQFRYEWEVEYAALMGRNGPKGPNGEQPPFVGAYPYRPVGWLVAGAIREDDASIERFFPNDYVGDDKDLASDVLFDDKPIGGHVNRFCNHFYDPIKGATESLDAARFTDGLYPCPKTGLLGAKWGIAAPAWALALQTGTTIFEAAAELQSRANHFAIADAKEAMWRAATGYDGSMTTKVAFNGTERMKYWATTFRTLGGAAHLLQDMGNAQHTRNEGHPFGVRGTYEKYVEWRTANTAQTVVFNRRGDFKEMDNPGAKPWPNYVWSSHPIPKFTKYDHYWHSPSGQGLAAYTNAGFLTPGKNIGNSDYPLPPPLATDSRYNPVTTAETIDRQAVNITRLYYPVPDSATGVSESIPMTRKTTVSWLAAQSNPPPSSSTSFYGPDEAVYDAQAGLQLPRAVAYSTGLIDHFFRGQLRIDAPASGAFAYVDTSKEDPEDARYSKSAFRTMKFKVTNATPAITPPGGGAVEQGIANGRLVAAVKYFRNTCWNPSLDLTGDWGAPDKDPANCRDGIVNQTMSASNILGAEQLALSRSCKVNGVAALSGVTIPAQATVDVECDFSEEPVPFGGTDMKLVVAIRGDLGEEKDAVIVQVEDISEPTWITYQNNTDYVAIEDSVYPYSSIPPQYDTTRTGGCMYSQSGTPAGQMPTDPDPTSVSATRYCAMYPIYNMIYANAQASAVPLARVKLAPSEFVQMAFLAPYRDGLERLRHSPRLQSTCGQNVHSLVDLIPVRGGVVVGAFDPSLPVGTTMGEREALMFANATQITMYDGLMSPIRNQVDVSAPAPDQFSWVPNAHPVEIYRGRGQQALSTSSGSRPMGCVAPIPYYVPLSRRSEFESRTTCGPNDGCWDGYDWDTHTYAPAFWTKPMFDALPNTKIGEQKGVTFCVDTNCTQ